MEHEIWTHTAFVEHASVAPSADAIRTALTVTITIELDDESVLDLVMRVVGALARRRWGPVCAPGDPAP